VDLASENTEKFSIYLFLAAKYLVIIDEPVFITKGQAFKRNYADSCFWGFNPHRSQIARFRLQHDDRGIFWVI